MVRARYRLYIPSARGGPTGSAHVRDGYGTEEEGPAAAVEHLPPQGRSTDPNADPDEPWRSQTRIGRSGAQEDRGSLCSPDSSRTPAMAEVLWQLALWGNAQVVQREQRRGTCCRGGRT